MNRARRKEIVQTMVREFSGDYAGRTGEEMMRQLEMRGLITIDELIQTLEDKTERCSIMGVGNYCLRRAPELLLYERGLIVKDDLFRLDETGPISKRYLGMIRDYFLN